eukprot:NODE_272_length_12196_cov_0.228404.p1 type:complete len:700 gc:universal NODE_272_length_12196_cov_0.228404:5994-3895(-)
MIHCFLALSHANDTEEQPYISTLDTLGNNTIWIAAFLALMIFFSVMRDRMKNIYSPRKQFGIDHVKNALPVLGHGWRWFIDIVDISDDAYLNSVGLDAYCFNKIVSLAGRWCIFWTIFSTFPLLFIHEYFKDTTNESASRKNSFETSPDLLPLDSIAWYFHFSYYYIISLSIYYYVFKLNSLFISLRQKFLLTATRRNYINSRSVIVQGVPHPMRSGPFLQQFFANMDIGEVEQVIVFRNFNSLLKIIKRRYQALTTLESLYEKWLKDSIKKNSLDSSRMSQTSINLLSKDSPPKLPFRKSTSNLPAYDLFCFSNNPVAVPNHSPLPHMIFQDLPNAQRPLKWKRCILGNIFAPSYWFIYHVLHMCRDNNNEYPSSYQHDAIDHYFEKFKKYDIQTLKVREWYKQNIDAFDEEYSAKYRQELEQFNTETSREFLMEQYLEFKTITKKLLELTKLDRLQKAMSNVDLERPINGLDDIVDIEDFEPTSSAIVTFKSTVSAQVASQILMHRVPIVLSCSMAPSYTDLYYANLSFPPIVNYIRYFAVLAGIFALIIFWNLVMAFLTAPFLSPKFFNSFIPNPDTAAFLQSVVPPLILNISVGGLPTLFTITAKFQGLVSWSRIEHDVIVKYFSFLVINVLILYQASAAVIAFLLDAIYNQKFADIQDRVSTIINDIAPIMVKTTHIGNLCVATSISTTSVIYY